MTGASFHALFGPALQLGIISRMRVYFEAIKYEKERNGGFISPFGYSGVPVAATIDKMCSMEWYWLRALKSQFLILKRFGDGTTILYSLCISVHILKGSG